MYEGATHVVEQAKKRGANKHLRPFEILDFDEIKFQS